MSFEPRDYFRHIIVEADFLIRESADLSFETFNSSDTLRRAFVRSLEVMGEAAKNLPDELRARHTEVDWRAVAGMRVRLVHGYFGLDYELVWEVVPESRSRIAGSRRSDP
jgi:uncharacterized protein with HEPN domain